MIGLSERVNTEAHTHAHTYKHTHSQRASVWDYGGETIRVLCSVYPDWRRSPFNELVQPRRAPASSSVCLCRHCGLISSPELCSILLGFFFLQGMCTSPSYRPELHTLWLFRPGSQAGSELTRLPPWTRTGGLRANNEE